MPLVVGRLREVTKRARDNWLARQVTGWPEIRNVPDLPEMPFLRKSPDGRAVGLVA